MSRKSKEELDLKYISARGRDLGWLGGSVAAGLAGFQGAPPRGGRPCLANTKQTICLDIGHLTAKRPKARAAEEEKRKGNLTQGGREIMGSAEGEKYAEIVRKMRGNAEIVRK